MPAFAITDNQTAQFHNDGFILVPEIFDTEEVALLRNIARAEQRLMAETAKRLDAEGGFTTLSLRNDLPEGIYSAIVRSRRMVDTMERLLGGEVYHYHHKMNMKEPFVGGAWEWHQDYGYC